MTAPIRSAIRALVPAAIAAGVLLAGAVRADETARPAATDATGALALGATAPSAGVKMKGVDGTRDSIASGAQKTGTLVVFTCNHCPWVKRWQQRIAGIGNAALGQGIGVVAINSNDPAQFPEDSFDEMVARAKLLGLRFPYVVDETSDVARAFGASHTPEAFLFDASGKLVYHGGVDDNAEDPRAVTESWLNDAVTAVLKGQPVPRAETKAMGCTIKLRGAARE